MERRESAPAILSPGCLTGAQIPPSPAHRHGSSIKPSQNHENLRKNERGGWTVLTQLQVLRWDGAPRPRGSPGVAAQHFFKAQTPPLAFPSQVSQALTLTPFNFLHPKQIGSGGILQLTLQPGRAAGNRVRAPVNGLAAIKSPSKTGSGKRHGLAAASWPLFLFQLLANSKHFSF